MSSDQQKRFLTFSGPGGVSKTTRVDKQESGAVARRLCPFDAPTLKPVIKAKVTFCSTICTDEHKVYKGLHVPYAHKTVKHSAKQFVDGMAHTNGIESVWAVLKRGFYCTYHSFSRKHTGKYVDEFVFRLNEGNCRIDTVDRLKSLVKGVQGQRLMYRTLIGKGERCSIIRY